MNKQNTLTGDQSVRRRAVTVHRSRRNSSLWALLIASPALLLMILPVVPVIPMSFTSGNIVQFPPSEWGVGAYRALFSDSEWGRVLYFSLQVALLAVLVATVTGTLAAIGVTRLRIPGKELIASVILAPLAIPVVVLGLGAFQFLVRFQLNGTLWGIASVHAIMGVPYVFLTVRAALSQLDMSLVRSAMSLGAGPLSVLRWVYLPALGPALASGALLAFVVSFDELVMALFLAGPSAITLPVKLFTELQFNLSPEIMAVSTLLLGAASIVVMLGGLIATHRPGESKKPVNA